MKKFLAVLLILVLTLSVLKFTFVSTVSGNQTVSTEFTVIIDAGHGGEDGGAVGVDGTNEKDLNLQIAIKLNEFLSLLGYKTHMVRTTDTALHDSGLSTVRERKTSDIHNRAKLMEMYSSCYYISIHQNKFDDPKIWGAQVFYSPNTESSLKLAEIVQNTLINNIQPENHRKVKPSGTSIYVLYKAKKTAIMVECGFVSNSDELAKLKDSNYQNKLAFSIAQGIVNYKISEVKNGSEV